MSSDMTIDVFADTVYVMIAVEKLNKLSSLPENFRLYECGWLDDTRQVMRVTGAEFRAAKTGKNKGKLSVMVPRTKQTAYVTAEEITLRT